MAGSNHLRDFKEVWRNACHTMWVELTGLRSAAALIHRDYPSLSRTAPITDVIYSPEARGRVDDVTPDVFLERLPSYQTAVVTSRVVLLSAAFELYLGDFLESYLLARSKYIDTAGTTLSEDGRRIASEVRKVRGIAERIEKFGELTDAKLNSTKPHLPFLRDVYTLRNIIAHRAGEVDASASKSLMTIALPASSQVALDAPQLLKLAAPVVKLAEELDRKIKVPPRQQLRVRR